MKNIQAIEAKIYTRETLQHKLAQIRFLGKTISFTNGCFDILHRGHIILHRGHIYSFCQAAKEGDFLVVGLNSDASTRRLKGDGRPVNDEQSRALVVASLLLVDAVVIFEEDTPLELINSIKPDVLVKGGDYTLDEIVGAKEVIANGGRVIVNKIIEGISTTGIIEKMKKQA